MFAANRSIGLKTTQSEKPLERYSRMLGERQYSKVLRAAIDDCGVAEDAVMESLDAFLQWFAAIPSDKQAPTSYVMIRGDVDRVWHAFILNTAYYADFCERYVGTFVHHQPWQGHPPSEWVVSTLSVLRAGFGELLHPMLANWTFELARTPRQGK